MEFFALKPNDDGYQEQIKSEDTVTKEDWDLRLGPAIWKRLRSSIPPDLFMDEKLELQNYILNHIFNLPAREYLILMKNVMGGTQQGKQMIERIARDMEQVYNQVHHKGYEEPNYQDDYVDDADDETDTPQEPEEPDGGEWWKDMLKR